MNAHCRQVQIVFLGLAWLACCSLSFAQTGETPPSLPGKDEKPTELPTGKGVDLPGAKGVDLPTGDPVTLPGRSATSTPLIRCGIGPNHLAWPSKRVFIMPAPRVSVRNWLRKPISPREGMTNSMVTRP